MKKQEILDIWKELIIISAKYWNVSSKKDKELILNKFDKYELKLNSNNTKYSNLILWFLLDLKGDLLNWRKLNIDSLNTDEYLENYLLTKNELINYNKLILTDSYRTIFNELNKIFDSNNDLIDNELTKLSKNFNTHIKKLNSNIIAQNFLIFSSFKNNIAKNYLANLFNFVKNPNQKKIILDLLEQITIFTKDVKKFGRLYYTKWNYNYKFLKFQSIDWKTELSNNIIDSSKTWKRTWFIKYEYGKLIKKL